MVPLNRLLCGELGTRTGPGHWKRSIPPLCVLFQENYDYRAYREPELYDSELECRDRADCESYTEGMSGTDSYEGGPPTGGYLGSYQRWNEKLCLCANMQLIVKLRFIWPCKSDCQPIFPKMQHTYSLFEKLWFVRPLIFQYGIRFVKNCLMCPTNGFKKSVLFNIYVFFLMSYTYTAILPKIWDHIFKTVFSDIFVVVILASFSSFPLLLDTSWYFLLLLASNF